eukprot:175484-Prymnesium_polylepis.2
MPVGCPRGTLACCTSRHEQRAVARCGASCVLCSVPRLCSCALVLYGGERREGNGEADAQGLPLMEVLYHRR